MRTCDQCKQLIYDNEHFVYHDNKFYHKSYCYGLSKQEHHRVSTRNAIQASQDIDDYDADDENLGDVL